jgi:Tol biopolymer transport system component
MISRQSILLNTLILIACLLSSCKQSNPITSTPTVNLLTLEPTQIVYPPPASPIPPTPLPYPYPFQLTWEATLRVPTATYKPLPTALPTQTYTPRPIPTIEPSPVPPEDVKADAVWIDTESGTEFKLLQISETTLGVVNLDWSPDGRSMWVNAALDRNVGGWLPTIPLVINLDSKHGWTPSRRSEDFGCWVNHAWSPKGRQLAYTGNDGKMWIANPKGQNPLQLKLPADVESLSQPSYSPDGRLLAAQTGRIVDGAYQYGVAVFDVVSRKEKFNVPQTGLGRPVWSPTGNAIALLAGVESGKYDPTTARLWIINVRDTKAIYTDLGPSMLTEGCLEYPTWLLDGKSLLVTIPFNPGVSIVDLEGHIEYLAKPRTDQGFSRPQGLATLPHGGLCDGAMASTDGRYVVYTTGSRSPGDMYVIDLINNTRFSLGTGDLCHGEPKIIWSPSEPRFLLRGNGQPLELVSAIDGSIQQLPGDGVWPAWSPDGRRVVYWRPEANGYALWLGELDTLKSIKLASPNLNDPWMQFSGSNFIYQETPVWSPDGRSIAFVAAREGHPEAYLLVLR